MKKNSKRYKEILKNAIKDKKVNVKEALDLVKKNSNTKFDESTRLVVDYSKLKNVNIVKPTIHKYLAGQTKSQFRRIDADEFTIATLLPVQRFKKAAASVVWKESRAMI